VGGKMKRKSKVIITVLLAMYIGVGVYGFMTQVEPIKLPETLDTDILIDLIFPDEGVIYVSYPENRVSKDDFQVFVGASSDACDILDQYYIPCEEDPSSVKPLRKSGKVTVSFDFFAVNKYEFVWPVCTFNSTWVQMWQGADFTVILPEGYEIVDITTKNAVKKPKRRFVDDRWEIETKTLENSEFQIEITYKKEE
jgi:hypothetical protein